MNKEGTAAPAPFLETKEYRRFAEFCDACRTAHYIGLCYGPPGVGKSFSAKHYAQWHLIEDYFPERFYDTSRLSYIEGTIASTAASLASQVSPELRTCRSVLYTPSMMNTPKRVEQEVRALRLALSHLVEATKPKPEYEPLLYHPIPDPTDLLIVDEADRLKTASLEQIRDIYDRSAMGVVLIGMPGLEKRLSRYAQLYSRVGFVHEFRALSSEEAQLVLQQQWAQWGLMLHADNAAEMEAVAAILRITRGNFRLLHRLLAQIERIAQINALRMITTEVVEIARQQLVIGSN
jgi:DNA transposition AAA+ family ATPase